MHVADKPADPTPQEACANCATPLLGRWCHACGQQRLGIADRRLSHLAREAFEALTDFDSRLWRSVLTLLLRPGRLSADYLAGRRQRWMSPIALFLLANLLYFLDPAISDFELPFADHASAELRVAIAEQSEGPLDAARREALLQQRHGQLHSEWTGPWIAARIAERDAVARAGTPPGRYTALDFARAYNQRRGELSRLLIILHVPALALMLWLMHPRRDMLLAEHAVVGLHLFAWLVLVAELSLPFELLADLLALPQIGSAYAMGLLVALPVYTTRCLQVVYGRRLRSALPLALLLLVGLVAFSIVIYRSLQFLLIAALV